MTEDGRTVSYQFWVARLENGIPRRVSPPQRFREGADADFDKVFEDAKASGPTEPILLLRQRYLDGIAEGDPAVLDSRHFDPQPNPYRGERDSDPANEHYGEVMSREDAIGDLGDGDDDERYGAWWEATRREAFGEPEKKLPSITVIDEGPTEIQMKLDEAMARTLLGTIKVLYPDVWDEFASE